MTEKNQPKIVFPCDYPIKVLGEAHTSFNEHVLAVMDKHAPGLTARRYRSETVVRVAGKL